MPVSRITSAVAVLVALILICTVAYVAPHEASADAGTIVVESTSITSEFPDGIRIALTASSDSEIESVAIHLNVGRQTRGAYDYLEMEPGRTVRAELFWRTYEATRYIPPGTEISYSFAIADSAGNRLETPVQTFVYHDTRFEWSEISRSPVTLSYYGDSKSRAQDILDTIVDTLNHLSPILGAENVDELIRVTMYDRWSEMRGALMPSSVARDNNLITEGQAFNKVGTLLVLGGSSSALGTASHEVTHIVVHRAGEGVYGTVPPWLHEGLAEYGNVAPGSSYDRALDNAIRNDDLLPITFMGSLPGKAQDVLLFYGQARDMVRMMIDMYGIDKMRELLAVLKSGRNMNDALGEVYGFDRLGLENLWRDNVGVSHYEIDSTAADRPTAVPLPTLLPYTLSPDGGGQYVGGTNGNNTQAPTVNNSQPTPIPSHTAIPTPVPGAPTGTTGSGSPTASGGGSAPTPGAPLALDLGMVLSIAGMLGLLAIKR